LAAVRAGAPAVAAALTGVDDGIVIADAETDGDLDRLAAGAMLSDTRLLCGSAGLAGALMRALALRENALPLQHPQPAQPWQGSQVLVVAASRHPQTIQQIEAAEAAGIPVIRPDLAWLRGEQAMVLDRCARQLAQGPLVITSQGLPSLPDESEAIVTHLALLVRELLDHAPPSGLVLTGGDMAMAVGRALGAEAIWLQGELQPGIPWGYWVGGIVPGMPVVTKAGGFGQDDALTAVIREWGQMTGGVAQDD
jgi:uncharacterized protein YgbK (DUF1537 family)